MQSHGRLLLGGSDRLRGRLDSRPDLLAANFHDLVAGTEIEFQALRGRTGRMAGLGWLISLVAGVVLGWISTIIPMGLGISEGSTAALFALIGAPSALGVALALARRVNQVVFALLGFAILTLDRVASRVHRQIRTRPAHV